VTTVRVCAAPGCPTQLTSYNPAGRCFVHTPDRVLQEARDRAARRGKAMPAQAEEELTPEHVRAFWDGEWLGA